LTVNPLAAPILALDQNVGFNRANNFLGPRFVEYNYVINRFQGGQDSRAL